jgi:hypothetical protein
MNAKPRFRTIVPSFHSGLAVNMVARSATAAITTTSFSTTQIFALHLEYPPRRDLRGRRGLKSNGGGLWPRKIPITTNTFWRLFRSTCPVRIWAELGRRALHFRYRPSFTALRLPQHSHILCNRGGFSNKLGDILPFLEYLWLEIFYQTVGCSSIAPRLAIGIFQMERKC